MTAESTTYLGPEVPEVAHELCAECSRKPEKIRLLIEKGREWGTPFGLFGRENDRALGYQWFPCMHINPSRELVLRMDDKKNLTHYWRDREDTGAA